MIIRSDIETAAAKQLAADLCCTSDSFFTYKNTVTRPELREGRRRFTDKPYLFRAASIGMGAVICTNESMTVLTDKLIQKQGTQIFLPDSLRMIDSELEKQGHRIGLTAQYYLPKTPYRPSSRSEGFSISVFEGSDLHQLYGLRKFDNALLFRTEGDRHDILAVCAINGSTVMGIAGASLDSPTMAQIGVDVGEGFRSMGIGSALVSACACEIFRKGLIPYYGTWSGNIISQRLAMTCGFYPAWVEVQSTPIA